MAGPALGQNDYRNEWIDYNKTYYKFFVTENRLYRISAAVLQTAGLGSTPAEHFQMWRNGDEVPLYTSVQNGNLPSDGYIEFVGLRNDGKKDGVLFEKPEYNIQSDISYFSDTSWYYLTVNTGRNKRFTPADNKVENTNVAPEKYFMHTMTDNFMWTWNFGAGISLTDIPLRSSVLDAGEGFAGRPFNGWSPGNAFYQRLQAYTDGPGMQLSINYSGNYPLDRNIETRVKDSLISSIFINRYNAKTAVVTNLSPKTIVNDSIRFHYKSTNDFYWENIMINQLKLTYPRIFNFGNAFLFNLSLRESIQPLHLRIGGLRSDNMPTILYDLTHLKRYEGKIKGDSSFFLLDAGSAREVWVLNQRQLLRNITQLTQRKFIDFTLSSLQGDYMIISAKKLTEGETDQVEEYRKYRSTEAGGSYKAQVYMIEELADQFAYGQFLNPLSIRNFVRFALDKFTVKPKMVFLLGKGSGYASFRNTSATYYVKKDITLVPTFGQPASDNLLVSETLADPTPRIPVGRLSAVWPEEIRIYLHKVKKFEALARNPKRTAADMEWRKEVLHLVGGDDEYLALNVTKPFMARYEKNIEDPSVSGHVQTFLRVRNADFPKDMQKIQNRIDSGAGLITYFGHSSTSSIDFNLSKPESFDNGDGKYQVMIANGCRAGDIFELNTNRLQSKNTSITENYIFAKDRGAISFVANVDYGLPNYLDFFTNEWYIALGKTAYGKTLGEVHQEAIRSAYNKVPLDRFNRINLEQECLHSDPAIVLFPYNRPDYTTDSSLITRSPAKFTVATDTAKLHVAIVNIGKAENDAVTILAERITPAGKVITLGNFTMGNIYKREYLHIDVPLQGNYEPGKNIIRITIDPEKKSKDLNFENNFAEIHFDLEPLSALPVFPYNHSIVNYNEVVLTASTANPIQKEMNYRLQVDTTALFNSPAMQSMDSVKRGGAISFRPNVKWANNTVYYWRISPVVNNQPVEWQQASFLYKQDESPGFNQSHFYQWKDGSFNGLLLDSSSRKLEFGDELHNIFVEHGIYTSSGTASTHFSVTVDGIRTIYSACIGQSMIFNIFDGKSFKPWDNTQGGRFGSAPNCGHGKEYNFEFKYVNPQGRKQIMDFLDQIPEGDFIVGRLNLDQPYDSALIKYWMNDTLIHGSGKSLYHSLKNLGFTDIDSMTRPRTFAFVIKKARNKEYPARWAFSEGLYDRNIQSFMANTQATKGSLLSPEIGTAEEWQDLRWSIEELPGTPVYQLRVYGLNGQNQKTLLKTLKPGEMHADLRSVDAKLYPRLVLEYLASDTTLSNAPNLKFWRVNYKPVADGALSSNHHIVWEHENLYALIDSLNFELGFVNPTRYNLAETKYRILLGDENLRETEIAQGTLQALPPGNMAILKATRNIDQLKGKYYLKVLVNEARNPAEQFYFNNRAIVPFSVDSATDAVQLRDLSVTQLQNDLMVKWTVVKELKVDHYELMYGTDSTSMTVLHSVNAKLNNRVNLTYEFLHTSPVYGPNYYRLRIVDRYGNVVTTAAIDYTPQINQFRSEAAAQKIQLSWMANKELRISKYTVEKMEKNGWELLATKDARNDGSPVLEYLHEDNAPVAGKNKYRLVIEDSRGNIYADLEDSVWIRPLNFEVEVTQFNLSGSWEMENEINLERYELEQSLDGQSFNKIAEFSSINAGAGSWARSISKILAGPGQYYFRIKAVDKQGNVVYSNVDEGFAGDLDKIYINPNPVRNFFWFSTGDRTTRWTIRLFDSSGKLLITESGTGSKRISTLSLPIGIYFLNVSKGNSKQSFKLLKVR